MIKVIIFILFFVFLNLGFYEVGLFKCKEYIIIVGAELTAFVASAFAVIYPFKD
jgi:hypothetical protein